MPAGWAIAGSAVLGYMGSQQAGAAATEANNANIAFQRENNAANREQIDRWNTLNDPFSAGGHREQYVQELNSFLDGNVGDIYQDPIFQGNLQMGQDAISRRFAAGGNAGTGAEGINLMQYTTEAAGGAYKAKLARLMTLSGAGGVGQGRPFQTTAPQGMDPRFAGGIAAAPYNIGANAVSTLGGIYGRSGSPSRGGGYTGEPSTMYSGTYDPNSRGMFLMPGA